jgi:hypothetical protein
MIFLGTSKSYIAIMLFIQITPPKRYSILRVRQQKPAEGSKLHHLTQSTRVEKETGFFILILDNATNNNIAATPPSVH